ncbi:MAG: hypothetical protein WD801_03455 [Gemmatimonadaceae bacterium]
MSDPIAWLPLLLRAGVVGILGGIGLVLTHIYSRRGPLIYPVYAALLVALALVAARFPLLSFGAYFGAVLAGMVVATGMAFVAVAVRARAARRALLASGRPLVPGRAPWWGLPLISVAIVGASAAVAFVVS